MARIDPSWSDAHLAAIARLEGRLGRAVCGAPTPAGDPCSEQPDASGRCLLHAGARPPEISVTVVKTAAAAPPPVVSRTKPVALMATVVIAAIILVGVAVHFTRDPAEGLWREAASMMAGGRNEEARPLLLLIVRNHPSSAYAARAREVLGIPVPVSAENLTQAERLFQEARTFYPLSAHSTADIEGAVTRYLALAESWPQDPLARQSIYEAAICYDHLGKPAESADCWRRFIERYPDDGRIPEALYALGYLHYVVLDRKVEGRQRFDELIAKFPGTTAAESARDLLGIPQPAEPTPAAQAPPQESGRPSVYTPPGGM